MDRKPIIYQLLPRLFTNTNTNCVPNGTYTQNSSGKMNDITDTVLNGIKELGLTHVWYTGIIEHATKTDYSAEGILPDNPYVVKGQAGSSRQRTAKLSAATTDARPSSTIGASRPSAAGSMTETPTVRNSLRVNAGYVRSTA